MVKMNKYLAKEILKRYIEEKEIEKILLSRYRLDSKLKTQRNEIHQLISEALGENLSYQLVRKIVRVFDKLGVKRVKNCGKRYYRGIG